MSTFFPAILVSFRSTSYFVTDDSGLLRILDEQEWRGIGITQSLGWEHFEVHGESTAHLLDDTSAPQGAVCGADLPWVYSARTSYPYVMTSTLTGCLTDAIWDVVLFRRVLVCLHIVMVDQV